MPFLSGEYECKPDVKGRMVLPSALKAVWPEASCGRIVIVRGFEPCIVAYPKSEWEKIFSRVSGLNEFNEEYRSFQRNFFRGNTEAELDKNGRFLIPKSMLTYSGINGRAIVVGLSNRIEIWDPARYENYLIKDAAEFSRMAQKYLGSDRTEA